jgi:mRNA interferase RelE/StbE
MWQVEYSDTAERDLLRLDEPVRARILKYFRERVSNHPDPERLADMLSGPLRGLWRFRIGDYRAICDIQEGRLLVLVLEIGHRGDVYR